MEAITWTQFLIIFVCCALTMVLCRVAPLFLLKGRPLPQGLERALGYIPPAAFAALVANDLFTPGMFALGLWPAAAPLLAAAIVVVVARLSGSLLWSALTGVAAYGLLTALV